MAESTKKINFGFRVTPERQTELNIISAKRNESVQAMLEKGLDLYLGASPIEVAPPRKPNVFEQFHTMLAEIFEHGDRDTISAVQQNIMVFHRIHKAAGTGAASNLDTTTTLKRKKA